MQPAHAHSCAGPCKFHCPDALVALLAFVETPANHHVGSGWVFVPSLSGMNKIEGPLACVSCGYVQLSIQHRARRSHSRIGP